MGGGGYLLQDACGVAAHAQLAIPVENNFNGVLRARARVKWPGDRCVHFPAPRGQSHLPSRAII